MIIVLSILGCLIVLVGFLFGMFKYKNRRIEPDYFQYYKKQDTTPVGKVGVFVGGLIMPDKHSHAFFHNIIIKIFKVVVPWPFNLLALKDKGVALLDPHHVHARKEFVPTHLEDAFGNDRDVDGTPYIELYKAGKCVWVPPSGQIYLDHGYFLFTGRLSGEPSACGKVANKSRLYYYGHGIKQGNGRLPHWEASFKIINGAFDKIKAKYKNIEVGAACSLLHWDMKKTLHDLLDKGCETIILASPLAIYSHFEDFNSTFYHAFEYIEEWEKEHNKKVKIIIAPQMGNFQPARQAFLDMLKDRLDAIPEGSSVMVAVTFHGMPWGKFQWEAWLENAPVYSDPLFESVKEMVSKYKFSKTKVIRCQDEFADPYWNPKGKYTGTELDFWGSVKAGYIYGTNMAYWDAIKEGYDYAIGLPIEFHAENSDTLMHHAMKNYENFDQYNIDDPIDYPDWSVPYVRVMEQGKTKVIYNGVPVGKYQHHIIEALYMALDSAIAKRKS